MVKAPLLSATQNRRARLFALSAELRGMCVAPSLGCSPSSPPPLVSVRALRCCSCSRRGEACSRKGKKENQIAHHLTGFTEFFSSFGVMPTGSNKRVIKLNYWIIFIFVN
ncbi:MAG: hypothetical protein ACK518_04750 [bacterium]